MNQDQVKDRLLQLNRDVDDFSVIFSGKQSGKVDGLYHPDSREIIIHNKNFTDDNSLMYTAIHEFAHHVHCTQSPIPLSTRAHTTSFWNIFHRLLFAAEEKKIYLNIFKRQQDFIDLTIEIKEKFLTANATLMKEFGKLLHHAYELCTKYRASFDDYVDRELLLHRTTAKILMKLHAMDIKPQIGYENMKTVAGIRDDHLRTRVEEAFLEGKSPDMVKAEYTTRSNPEDPREHLLHERDRIVKSIENLSRKLERIEKKISEIEAGADLPE